MNVCMYLCMYVFMYVCMHLFIYVCTHVRIYVCMHACICDIYTHKSIWIISICRITSLNHHSRLNLLQFISFTTSYF